MNTETIIKCYPCALMQPHPAHQWQIVHDARGYFAVHWFDVNKLTPEERVAHDAEISGMPEWIDEQDEAWAAHERAETPRFPSIELAEAWAQVQDAENNISADLDAYNAPSECYKDAYRGTEQRMHELLLQSNQPEPLRSDRAAWPFPDHQC